MTQMEYRFLGRSGLKVSVLSLGGWITYGGTTGNDVAYQCLKAAYDAGVNFFDNAEGYAAGESEKVFGDAIKHFGWKRSDLVISTKIYWGGDGPNDKGLSRKHIIEGTNASLKRLQMDYVDLIFAHRPDAYTPMEEVVRAFNHIIDTGKAFYWGTSEWSAEQIQDAHRVAEKLGLIGPLMEQVEYSILKRERFEKEYDQLYKKHGLGTTIFSPLAGGFLTGKYNDGIPEGSRVALAKGDKNLQWLVDMVNGTEGKWRIEKARALVPVAERLGATLGQLALAWALKNKNVSTIITGASKPEQFTENLKALEIQHKLTPEILKEIDDIVGNKPTLPADRW
ncbi:hypothetical protein HK097_003618 [Rhizophlyctis rosea]|uniref:NADP-dependent oxidoreductase domain-containing protein n=1 Tax=Rhizophlyctis rosea TaxID=64517 RepID=A0AAD5SFW2_9FUNG|nr:hypothetical protein HK097_003618 [Rhizophlyctis rosea]